MSLLGNIWVKLGLKSDDFNKGLDNAERRTSKFGTLMKGLATRILSVAVAMKAVASTAKTLADFEAATSKLAAVLGKTKEGISGLTQTAIDLGRRTQYTASEVVGLQTELAKLGFVEDDIKGMQEAVLKFAAAVGTDLSSAAARAGATMRGFGLTAKETNDMLNVMAISTSKSALSFNYLDSTLGKLVPVTKAFGFDTRDTITLLGTLANAGIDASSAGTALRRVFKELANENSKLNKALGGQPKTMEELITGLQKLKGAGMGVQEAFDLVGAYAGSAFAALVNGADDCRVLYGQLQNVDSALDDMYETMTKNVRGAIKELASAWEGFVLTLQNSTGPIASFLSRLARGVNTITDLVNGVSLKDSRTKQMAETIMQQGQFKTYEDYLKEIQRAEAKLNAGFSNAVQGMTQEQLRQGGQAALANEKQMREYLDALRYAAFQQSQKEQAAALENMFGGGGKVSIVPTEDTDPLKDLLDSLSEKSKDAKDGMSELNAEVREYVQEIADANEYDDEMRARASEMMQALYEESGAYDKVTQSVIEMANETATATEIAIDHAEKLRDVLVDAAEEIGDAMMDSAVGSLEYLAEALGSGEWNTGEFIRNLVGPLADAAISAGTLILTTGEGLEAVKKAFESLNGYAAIAAGAALVALGLSLKAGMAALSKGGASAGTASTYSNPYTYAGGLGTAPSAGYGASIDVNVTGVLKGQDIYLASEQYQRNRGR